MSAIARRAATARAFRAPRASTLQARRTYADKDSTEEQSDVLRKGARKDPELYVNHHLLPSQTPSVTSY